MRTMSASREIPPPWVAFPYMDWPPDGSGGPAGFHMWTWTSWFGALSAEAKGEYKMRYPEPARWAGFYEFVETGKPNLALLKKSILLSFESERFYSASDVESVFPGAVFDRLVTLLIREAIIGRFNEIEIRDGEPECPVFYTR